MSYLEYVTKAYDRGYKIGKIHGRAENIEAEESLKAAFGVIDTQNGHLHARVDELESEAKGWILLVEDYKLDTKDFRRYQDALLEIATSNGTKSVFELTSIACEALKWRMSRSQPC